MEARSIRDEVLSRIAEVAKWSDVSVSNVADVLTGKVQQVAAQFAAHTSHAVGQVAQKTGTGCKSRCDEHGYNGGKVDSCCSGGYSSRIPGAI